MPLMDKKFLVPAVIVVIVIAATIVIVFMLKNDNETTILYCGPDKSIPVSVFKNPSKAFPAFSADYTVKLNAGVTLLDTIKNVVNANGTTSSEINTKATDLREKLNQENIRMENLLKANFYAFNTNPCDSFIRRKYFSILDTLTLKITEIEKLRAELTVQSQKGTSVISKTKEFVRDTNKIKENLDRFAERISFN